MKVVKELAEVVDFIEKTRKMDSVTFLKEIDELDENAIFAYEHFENRESYIVDMSLKFANELQLLDIQK